MREIIHFQCTECQRINYSGMKDKKKKPERIELKKSKNDKNGYHDNLDV